MKSNPAHQPTEPLYRRLSRAPVCVGDVRVADDYADFVSAANAAGDLAAFADVLGDPRVGALITGALAGSPYLRGLMSRDIHRLARCLMQAPEARFQALVRELEMAADAANSIADVMRAVRLFKSEVALLTALADIGGVWPVMTVTGVLTSTADAALAAGVRFLFRQAVTKGDWLDEAEDRDAQSGYIVLGMGKHGAGELNYSSDIDLIVFYDLAKAKLKPGLEPQAFFVRLTRDLVKIMQERTADGYVFRTDLRLRPDPGATQIALSTDAALHYYESFGQNWERAALIKARPVAGDIEAGTALLAELSPFIWRRHLDFAAIADIHAMKRQIHAFRGLGGIGVAGHNVKLGRGGIREIEFFTQTQQLIAGGRQRDLRMRPTLQALAGLVSRGWIKEDVRADLEQSYLFLRGIEHRIQMVADEQTHSLPVAGEELERFSRFAGYETVEAFSRELIAVLETVQRHYVVLFEDMPELTSSGVNMVFAGEDDDPDTLAALSRMGYKQPASVIATIRGWHAGRYAAVRSARSRERLTEVQPQLVAALAETAEPDRAFMSFDRFVAELPTGVQLFSLLRANPGLLRLVADIMGTAPRLAQILSRRRRLLDAVIDPRTFNTLPAAAELDKVISTEIGIASDVQDALDRARVVGSEQAFLIGVRVLSGSITANQAGGAYALLAERLVNVLQGFVELELGRAHGLVAGGGAAVVAMGKLGGREMTASSDLDLIVVYDFDETATQSSGLKPLAPSQYYSRLTQRLITALSAPTSEGRLYEVDLRLRPSGQSGPVATRLASFIDYQANDAWTWEHMALTRARVVTGPPELRTRVEAAIHQALTKPHDPEKLTADVREMRERIAAEKGTDNIWDLKQVRGGLVDLEFIAQYLQLKSAAAIPRILDQNTSRAFRKLAAAGILSQRQAETLIPAAELLHNQTQLLRLCLDGPFEPATAPEGLRELLVRAGDVPTFAALEARISETLADVRSLFDEIVAC
ncbi:MAG: bifunctional [glutamine synthetase] adenylyltransferase/[glutamine synthetase]-adenylyl-L-tyrosine phosphorylase [Hyphomicrobiaceae bacterium]|nr:bifunctional [glutamine synthetase] adenylyltransferase/[glutamine synthetase]-adenylyl-L-tyrosine phosphorylase [Hyphomicrobiaceae bacterium]